MFTFFFSWGHAPPNSLLKGWFVSDLSRLNDDGWCDVKQQRAQLQCADCRGYITKVPLWTSAWLPCGWVLPQRYAVVATSHHVPFQHHHVTVQNVGLLPRRTFSLTFLLKRCAPTTEWVGVRPCERRIRREPRRTSKKCKLHNCKARLLCRGQAFVWMRKGNGACLWWNTALKVFSRIFSRSLWLKVILPGKRLLFHLWPFQPSNEPSTVKRWVAVQGK